MVYAVKSFTVKAGLNGGFKSMNGRCKWSTWYGQICSNKVWK